MIFAKQADVPLFDKEGLGEIYEIWPYHSPEIPLSPPLKKGETLLNQNLGRIKDISW